MVWPGTLLHLFCLRFDCLRVDTREVHSRCHTAPDQRWMTQIARNMTMADWSVLAQDSI